MWQQDNWSVFVCVLNDVSAPLIYHILVGSEEEDRGLQSLELLGQVKGH